MKRILAVTAILLSVSQPAAGQPGELRQFFKTQIGLEDAQIEEISRGIAVAKLLPSKSPAEIFVFGAVYVNAVPEEYVRLVLNVERLRSLPGYLGLGRVGSPPAGSQLDGFTLEPDDIRGLRKCRPGKCDVQLPAETMHQLQRTVNWSDPGAAGVVNERVREMALDFTRRYQESGNSVLVTYRDKEDPFDVRTQLEGWLARLEALPVYFPDLHRYLLDYPHAPTADVESLFYWEKVDFGLKPTLRLNHAIAFRSAAPAGGAHIVAVKQLYASHYFQLALDLSACVRDRGGNGPGFYLVSLKGSTQQGLTGFRGSLLRRIVVEKTQTAQRNILFAIKKALEQP